MDLHFYFFILIFPPSPGATDGRGQRLFRVSASQPSGVWSVVPSAGVPSPHVNIHCGGWFCSAELQRGGGHTNGGAGEGDQGRVVLTVFSNSYISARFFSNSIVESTFLCFNKCPVFQQQSNRELNKCSGGGRGVDIASLRHLHHPP